MSADTKARIFAAADEISATGQNPTFMAIRKHLGGGSFSTISDAMAEWKATKAAKSVPVQEPIPLAISEKLNNLGSAVWSIAIEMANARLNAEREALEAARIETDAARREAVQLADQLTAELETAQKQIATMEAERIALQAMVKELQSNVVTSQSRAETADARASELRQELDRAHTDRDKAVSEAATAREEAAELRGRLKATEPKPNGKRAPQN